MQGNMHLDKSALCARAKLRSWKADRPNGQNVHLGVLYRTRRCPEDVRVDAEILTPGSWYHFPSETAKPAQNGRIHLGTLATYVTLKRQNYACLMAFDTQKSYQVPTVLHSKETKVVWILPVHCAQTQPFRTEFQFHNRWKFTHLKLICCRQRFGHFWHLFLPSPCGSQQKTQMSLREGQKACSTVARHLQAPGSVHLWGRWSLGLWKYAVGFLSCCWRKSACKVKYLTNHLVWQCIFIDSGPW